MERSPGAVHSGVPATIPETMPWDQYDAYLFDIDGTLLTCRDAVHYFAFCEALTALAGTPTNLDGVLVHGNTDVGILRDALALRNVPDNAWRPQLQQTIDAMARFVAARESDICAEALPGVHEVLAHLKKRGAALGVGTGNLAAIGTLKLKRAGLAHFFDFGAFSDQFEYRRDVFRSGIEEARRRTHPDAKVCVVGDTPSDIQAAHENGVDVIAVATGIFTLDELAREHPTLCINTLATLLPKSGISSLLKSPTAIAD